MFIHIIVIPRFVRLYEERIHELQPLDYLPYRRTNHVCQPHQCKPCYCTLISVDLAQYKRSVLKFAISVNMVNVLKKTHYAAKQEKQF